MWTLRAVGDGVDVDLDGVGEVAVEEDRRVAGDLHGVADVAGELGVVADDLHGAAAEDVAGADDQGVADAFRDRHRLGGGAGDAVDGLAQVEAVEEGLEALAVLGEVDGVRGGAEDGDAGVVQGVGELQRGLAAELDDDAVQRAVLLLDAEDFEDVLEGEGLEVEAVGGVVVGGDGLGVAVDHDGLVAGFRQREAGVAAAVVELDALADAVGAAAEDDDLAGAGGAGFVLGVAAVLDLVGRVHVGGLRLELGAAGVDALEDRADAEALALGADAGLGAGGEGGEAGVGEAELLEAAERVRLAREAGLDQAGLLVDDLADAGEEPGVVAGDGVDLFVGEAVAHRLGGDAQAVGGLLREGLDDRGLGVGAVGAGDVDLVEAGEAGLERAERLLDRTRGRCGRSPSPRRRTSSRW